MNQESLTPNLEELHLDTLDLLKRINDLIDTANEVSIFDFDIEIDGIKKYEDFKVQIKITSDKVQNLELRMAIVAPTNAGKSTIINAMIGKETLPSRSTAMTTIPTEVVLNSECLKPFLEIKEETLELFQDTITTLKAKFDDIASSNRTEDDRIHSELKDTVEKIKNQELIIDPLVYEYVEIQSQLKILNDIIRICQILIPSHNPLGKIIAFPRIETKLWNQSLNNDIATDHDLDKSSGKLSGKLIVIDTPGPNEILGNPKDYSPDHSTLWSAVKEQLQQSSIVVFVVDFTKLRDEADSEIINEIEGIQRIKNDLYILVNKIDQRQEGDIELEQLSLEVARKLKIDVSDISKKIFPIKAKAAFTATNCLVDLANCSDNENVSDKNSVKKFAKEFRPHEDLNIFLKDKTKEGLSPDIDQMLESSKFKAFIDNILKIMIEEAAPRSIADALNTSIFLLKELSDKVRTQKVEISKSEIKNQIEYLEQDKKKLEQLKEGLDEVIEELNKIFANKIKEIISNFQNKIVNKLDSNYKNATNDDIVFYLNSIKEHQNDNKALFTALEAIQEVTPENEYYFESISLLVGLVSEKQASISESSEHKIIFKSKKDAEEFATKVAEELQAITQSTFVIDEQSEKSYKDRIQEEIKKIQEEFWNRCISQGSERVLDDVRNRFGEFGIELYLPLDREMFFIDYKLDVGETSKARKNRAWWHWKSIRNLITDFLNISEKELEYYFLSRQIYVPTSNIIGECKATEKEIIENTNTQLHEQKEEFSKAVGSLLNECKNNLSQALEKSENEDLRKQKLENLSLQIDEIREVTEKKHKFAKQIIK